MLGVELRQTRHRGQSVKSSFLNDPMRDTGSANMSSRGTLIQTNQPIPSYPLLFVSLPLIEVQLLINGAL